MSCTACSTAGGNGEWLAVLKSALCASTLGLADAWRCVQQLEKQTGVRAVVTWGVAACFRRHTSHDETTPVLSRSCVACPLACPCRFTEADVSMIVTLLQACGLQLRAGGRGTVA